MSFIDDVLSKFSIKLNLPQIQIFKGIICKFAVDNFKNNDFKIENFTEFLRRVS